MLAPYSKIPVIPVVIGFMVGILLFNSGMAWYWAAGITVISTILLYFPDRFYTVGLLAVGLGWYCAYVHQPEPLPARFHGNESVVAASVERVEIAGETTRMLVDVDSINRIALPRPIRMWASLMAVNNEVEVGSRIRAKGYIFDNSRFEGLPYETDYGTYYMLDGAVAQITVNQRTFELLSPGESMAERIRRYRTRLIDDIYFSGVEEPTADFLVATVCNEDHFISRETQQIFRTLGLAHLLALSGFHVGIFAAMVSLLLYPLRLWRRFARSRHIFVILAVWAYVIVVGMPTSAVRAAVLTSVVLLAHLIQRRGSSFNALGGTALLMLAANPWLLFSPGFQLSFAAVLGLVVFAEPLNPYHMRRRWPHRIAAMFAVPVAAVLGTGLLSAIYFHNFPLYFLPANLVIGFVASLLIGCGIVLMLLGMVGVVSGILVWICDQLYSAVDGFCRLLMQLPFREISDVYPKWPAIILIVFATVMLAIALNLKRRRLIPAVAAATLAVLAVGVQSLMAEQPPRGELYIPTRCKETRLIIRHDSVAALYTETSHPDSKILAAQCSRRYAAWLRIRGCSERLELIDSVSSAGISCSGPLVLAGPYSFWLMRHKNDLPTVEVDYLVPSRVGMTDFDAIAACGHVPTQILLTSAMNRKKRNRCIELCREAGLPVYNAADSMLRLSW